MVALCGKEMDGDDPGMCHDNDGTGFSICQGKVMKMTPVYCTESDGDSFSKYHGNDDDTTMLMGKVMMIFLVFVRIK